MKVSKEIDYNDKEDGRKVIHARQKNYKDPHCGSEEGEWLILK